MVESDKELLKNAARHLLQNPLTCIEQHGEQFSIIRRHELTLDRWFTQRLGYRLHVSSTTARLFKATIVPHRPVLVAPTSTGRAMNQRECMLLSLILAAVASGPRVISLRDLIDDVRTAAADAQVTLTNEAIERRAFIIALKWMIQAGIAKELHEHIDRYEHDESADAILEIDPDRVGLLPLAALGRADTAADLLNRDDRRVSLRQWMRAQLVENPAVYAQDMVEHEWKELRRRVGEEVSMLDQMFGLHLEIRAEGFAAIDASGKLSDRLFPTTGTTSHAALLFIDWLSAQPASASANHVVSAVSPPDQVKHATVEEGSNAYAITVTLQEAQLAFDQLAQQHSRHWSKTKLGNLSSFLLEVLELLQDLRLVVVADQHISPLPAAARFSVLTTIDDDFDEPAEDRPQSTRSRKPRGSTERSASGDDNRQGSLW
ncbi:MAG: TIGR02678 family protein [Granulosicoccus sp.]